MDEGNLSQSRESPLKVSNKGNDQFIDGEKLKIGLNKSYGYNTVIDTNNQTSTNLKFNLPYSLSRLPEHVDKTLVNIKPEIV